MHTGGLRVKVIKASWLFCPAENAPQNGGVLPGSLGRALVGYRLTKSRPARGKAQAGRNLFCPGDGRLRNICLVLLLFFALCSSDGNNNIKSTDHPRNKLLRLHTTIYFVTCDGITMSSATTTANKGMQTPHFLVDIGDVELHSAHKAGMEEANFRSFFDVDGITQMKCASGPDHCTNPLPVP